MKTHNSFYFYPLEAQGKNFHANNANFLLDHSTKSISKSKTSQTIHSEKIRRDAKKSDLEFNEDILRSMFSVDVQSITKPKREIQSATVNKRKLRIYPKELIPIPKIETQKSFSNISPDKVVIQQRPLTSTANLRHSTSDSATRPKTSKYFNQDYIKPSKNNCLTITQLDSTFRQKSKPAKSEFLPVISQTKRKRPSTTKSTKRIVSTNNECHISNQKPTKEKEDNQMQNDQKHIQFDRKSFIQKLNELSSPESQSKSSISFANGRVMSSIHYNKEPDRYVLACAIHIEFSFNFFTFPTNPTMVNYLSLDEDSYDLFDTNSESSNRLRRCSKYMQLTNELFGNYENPLLYLFNVVPSLVRRDIEKQHLIDQAQFIPSLANQDSISFSLRTDVIQKYYPNMKTADSAFVVIEQNRDMIYELDDNCIDEIDNDESNEMFDMCFSKLNYLLPDLS